MRWLFRASVAVALVLCLIEPALIPYVAVGLALRAFWEFPRLRPRIGRRGIVAALVVVAAGVVAVMALLNSGDAGRSGPSASLQIELPATYVAMSTLAADRDVAAVDERVRMARADLEALLRYRPLIRYAREHGLRPRRLVRRGLIEQLGEEWQLTESNLRLEFERTREEPLSVRRVPGETDNTIDLPDTSLAVGQQPDGLFLTLPFGEGSTMTLVGERYAIGTTFPAPTTREERPVADVEEVELPISESDAVVEFELRSPWVRNAYLAPLADLSAASGFQWLVLLALGLVTDGFKDALKRLAGRFRASGARDRPSARGSRRP